MLSRRAFFELSRFDSWEVLWDASSYFVSLSEALETARKTIVLVGWQIDSRLPLVPDSPRSGAVKSADASPPETLKAKLLRLVERNPELRIDLLYWDHAYVYVFEREPWQGRVWDDLHPRIRFVFDNRHPVGASHHEKLAIIDSATAFCGGIDLCDDRWDSPEHLYEDPRRSLDLSKERHGPYHDIGVRVTGPVCRSIAEHVASRWRRVTTLPPLPVAQARAASPPPAQARAPRARETAGTDPAESRKDAQQGLVYLSRTRADLESPIVREVEFLFLELIAKARRRVLLEGQYYWSGRLNERLIARMEQLARERQPGEPPLEVVIHLTDLALIRSANRLMATHQLRLLAELEGAARRTGTTLRLRAPRVHSPAGDAKPKLVYVHSKVVLIDDRFLSIGSANLATRAFRVDTELQLTWEASTPAERKTIESLARAFEDHWKAGTIEAHPIDADSELRENRRRSPLLSRIPWEKAFDPSVPWLYPLRRRFLLAATLRPAIPALVIALAWLGGAMIVLASANLSVFQAPSWPLLYALLAASVWLLPVPFVLSCVLCTWSLGGEIALKIHVPALWVSSFLGYFWNRAFPSWGLRYFRALGLAIPRRLGTKNFAALVEVLLDPRISIRAKIAGQGVFSIYLPWFILAHGLIIPGELLVLVRGVESLLGVFSLGSSSPKPGVPELLLLLAWCWTALASFSLREEAPRRGRRRLTEPLAALGGVFRSPALGPGRTAGAARKAKTERDWKIPKKTGEAASNSPGREETE